MMLLTQEQVKKILPLNSDYVEWTNLFNEYLDQYEINTLDRMVMFLAQCSHESNQFTVLKENLNYSASGLMKTFPKYFNLAMAGLYQHKPVDIANKIYANRMGNGGESTGDGWKYSGKGVIQLTGKENYSAFATYIGKTLEETIIYLQTKEGALLSAIFYWNDHQVSEFSDAQDIEGARRRINGGLNGIDNVKSEYSRIYKTLS